MINEIHPNISQGIQILKELGFPKAQQNERSALCLLALLDVGKDNSWEDSQPKLIGITPIMEFTKREYGREYAPNSRETFRRQTMHQFVDAGLVRYNPDNPKRPTNSPKSAYQIESTALSLIKTFNSYNWKAELERYLLGRKTLIQRYAKVRESNLVPVKLEKDKEIYLSPGEHNELIKAIIEQFAPQFVPGGQLVYVGDTGDKWGYFDEDLLLGLGVKVNVYGKMPDVVLYYPEKEWLILVESVTSHGPVDGKRHNELEEIFKDSLAGLVYVTAFPNRQMMARYLNEIAWETEVWVSDNPTHMIHFNGERFLGPY